MILLSHKGKISAEGKNVKVLGVPFEYTELIYAISEFGYFGEFKEAVSGAATQNGNDSSYGIRDNTVEYNGREAHLTDREMMLFEYLLKKHGRVVSRSEIMADVWNEPDSETNVADVYVSYLKKKLVPVFGQGVLISVRGKGYILQLPS